jgi:hypothetical protein
MIPFAKGCLEEDESATHIILCDCEAVAHVRFRHLSQFFMEPSDYYDAPTYVCMHVCIRGRPQEPALAPNFEDLLCFPLWLTPY